VLGIEPADARFSRNELRVRNRDRLIEVIEAALAAGDRAHWLGLLADAGVPAGSIRTIDEVYQWEQTRSQGLVVTVDHPVLGQIELPGPPLRFDGHQPAAHQPPPLLGQHDASVRAWLAEQDEPADSAGGDIPVRAR
jgi:crotonobetainyl-CoA:carnitine CoA-transferase CaiB-like acyl-CoA transferase